MAEAQPSTSAPAENYNIDDFRCAICQEIFQTPVRTQKCQHIFCRRCFLMAVKASGTHCPFCRGELSKLERSVPERASDIEVKMHTLSLGCTYCGKLVKLSYMRIHYRFCKTYMEEIGITPKNSKPQSDPLPVTQLDTTYKCPLCQLGNLNREALLDHCNSVHCSEVAEALCPICSALPFGDPNRTTKNFVCHLNVRHLFNYEDFVNVNLTEEAQLQAAIAKSIEPS